MNKVDFLKKEASYECIYYPARGRGRIIPVFKVLISTACEYNCRYCSLRCGREIPRIYVPPEEMADIFMEEYKRGRVDGMFLSSGIIKDAEWSQEKILETAKILREKYGFTGYLHLKVLPGAPPELIRELSRYATRLSLNLEAPGDSILKKIAPRKHFTEFFSKLGIISKYARSTATQIIIGRWITDRQVLSLSHTLYRKFGITRVYYSPFRRVPDTPMENEPECPGWRIKRLYQADRLIKIYGFKPHELVYDEDGNLPDEDPKELWARFHPEFFPVDIRKADYWTLLRVPGIGPERARLILEGKWKPGGERWKSWMQ